MRIVIQGAWAELRGTNSASVLKQTLAVYDPKRHFNPAFKQGRWDGRIRLYDGKRFPAGLWRVVAYYLYEQGIEYEVVNTTDKVDVDLSRWNPDSLQGITLYPHQVEVCRAMLAEERGIAKAATGSGKTGCMASIAQYLFQEHGWRTLVVVPKRGLVRQTRIAFTEFLDGSMTVGQCGDGMKTEGDVVVGTAQTLVKFKASKKKRRGSNIRDVVPPDFMLKSIVEDFEVLMLDEAHHASAITWYDIAMASNAKRRYGFSGTPLKDDLVSDLKLQGATGPIVVDIPSDILIDAGLSAKPKIVMVASDNASHYNIQDLKYAEAYTEGVVNSETHNRAVVQAVEWMANRKRKTLVICRRKDQIRYLSKLLEERGVEFGVAWGATDTEERARLTNLLAESKLDCIVASTIFDEGTDVPQIDAIVLAEGIKATTNSVQRIGRGMRRKDGDNDLWVVDFVPLCHETLKRHAVKRCTDYEAQGYEVGVVDEWPEDWGEVPDTMLPFVDWSAFYEA